MKVKKLTQHKTRAVLFRMAQPLGTDVCINKLLEFTSNADYSICMMVSKSNPTDFYISIRPNGMGDLWLNGKNIAILYPEGGDGWKMTTYQLLKMTFPHEHRLAVETGRLETLRMVKPVQCVSSTLRLPEL